MTGFRGQKFIILTRKGREKESHLPLGLLYDGSKCFVTVGLCETLWPPPLHLAVNNLHNRSCRKVLLQEIGYIFWFFLLSIHSLRCSSIPHSGRLLIVGAHPWLEGWTHLSKKPGKLLEGTFLLTWGTQVLQGVGPHHLLARAERRSTQVPH